MQRKSNEQSLKDVILEIINTYKYQNKIHESTIRTKWANIVGNNVANYTTNLYIQNKVVYLALSSAPLKHQLFMSKSTVIQNINQYLQQDNYIKDLIFI